MFPFTALYVFYAHTFQHMEYLIFPISSSFNELYGGVVDNFNDVFHELRFSCKSFPLSLHQANAFMILMIDEQYQPEDSWRMYLI